LQPGVSVSSCGRFFGPQKLIWLTFCHQRTWAQAAHLGKFPRCTREAEEQKKTLSRAYLEHEFFFFLEIFP
jgi:hypothetical protein